MPEAIFQVKYQKKLRTALLSASLSAMVEWEPQLCNSEMQGLDLCNNYIGISVITKKVTRVITLTNGNISGWKKASNRFLGLVKTQVTYSLIYIFYIVEYILFKFIPFFCLSNYDTRLDALLDIYWSTNAEYETDKKNIDFN